MAYSTVDDIRDQIPENEIIQLTDDVDLGVIDISVVERAVADADAEINSYCGERYAVPFSPVPLIVRKFSVVLSIYNLFMRRGDIPDDRETHRDNAILFLKDVAKGIVTLGVDAPAEETQDTVGVTTVKTDRIFSIGQISKSTIGSMDNY